MTQEQILNNLALIREEMDKPAETLVEQAEKLNKLSSLLGLASETQSWADKYLNQKHLEVMDSKDKGMNLKQLLKLKSIEETYTSEYSDRIMDNMVSCMDALRTLISLGKKEMEL